MKIYISFTYFLLIIFILMNIIIICNEINYRYNYSVESEKIHFVSYISSKLENEWLNILANHENDYYLKYCYIIEDFNNRLEKLDKDIHKCKTLIDNSCNGEDLSYFIYKSYDGKYIKEYIEPLFGILRNTFSICKKGEKGNFLSKNYLLPSYILAFDRPIVYIDAGASSFYDGLGGSSQSYFYDFYKQYPSVKFNEWILWEAAKQNMTKIKEEIPNDLKDIYHYYNKPIKIDIKSEDNPLNYIKKYQNKAYVIFKLDIDTPSVEIPIFNYLLENDDIIPDEFYFEYHFYQPYMMRNGWGNDVDKKCSLYCATKKFLKLRNKGIRSHAWL